MQQVGIDFVTKGEREVERAIRAVGREVDNLTKKSINASTASQRLEAQRKRETQELERLRGKYVQGYTAMQMYSKELNDLARARRAGIISSQQQATEVARLNAAMESGSFAARGMGDANHIASRKTNAFGMATQQAGYQVGDFLVQVQGGTNAFVAFGQQATQLVGILPMLAGQFGMNVNRLIAISAGLGIAIPLATALGAAFMRTRESAEESASAVDQLSTALSSANSAMNIHEMSVIELTDKYGLLGLEARKASIAIAEADYRSAVQTIRNEAIPALDELAEAFRLKNSVEMFSYEYNIAMQNIDEMKERMKLGSVEVERLFDAYEQFNQANTLEEQVVAAIDLREALSQIPEEVLATDAELNNAVKSMNNLFLEGSELKRLMDQLSESAPGSGWMDNAIKGVNGLFNRVVAAIREVQNLKAESSDRPVGFRTRPRAAPPMIDEEAYFDNRPPGTRPVARGEIDLTTGTLGSGGGGGGGGRGPDPVEELNRAQKAVDQLRASYDKQYATELKVAEAKEKVNELIRLNPDLTDQANQVLQDYIASLEQAKNPMEELAQTMRKSMSDAFMSIVDGTSSAEDAFRNMARAILKQAFELMVIKPIMDSLFGAQGGSGGSGLIGKIFGFEKGGAFNNGNVTPFANGGVVSNPTMFPMAGSQTGLMGEAGPEAIMPLKRGKGGKLGVVAEGGQQPVVINQSFNFSANGDDSVKRIIAQEAPRIASLTQKQIIDQRRRGGNLKAAFG